MSFLKKSKFTLVEILLVLGVIAILAAVIVPKIGTVKDNAKLAGVDTNTRMIQAYTQSVIQNYDSSQATVFEKELTNAFSGNNLSNPFTKGVGIGVYDTVDPVSPSSSAVISTSDDTSKTVSETKWTKIANDPKLTGSIIVSAYPASSGTNNLEVAIYPCDKNGNPIMSKKVVVTP